MNSKNNSSHWLLLIPLLLIAGCNTIPATRSGQVDPDSKLMILPPSDVVQKGVPHPVGEGSGRLFGDALADELIRSGKYELIYRPNSTVGETKRYPDRNRSIEEARIAGADYLLIATLGEFRDAAPMTFRSDMVTLNKAALMKVKDGTVIWELQQEFILTKSNLGSYRELLERMAKMVVESISE